VEDVFRTLGTAALIVGIVSPLLFLGIAGLVFVLAIAAVIRREPYGVGELACTIVLSVVFQIGSGRADLWSGFPLRLFTAGVLVFGVSSGVRWIWGRIRPSTDPS
jgi:hypothetical protein